jgi:hypothetical protein
MTQHLGLQIAVVLSKTEREEKGVEKILGDAKKNIHLVLPHGSLELEFISWPNISFRWI